MSVDLRIHIVSSFQINQDTMPIKPLATYEFATRRRLVNEVRKMESKPLGAPIAFGKELAIKEDMYGGLLFYVPINLLVDTVLSLGEDSGYGNDNIGYDLKEKWKGHYAVLFWC